MAIETEQKYKVSKPDQIRQKLKQFGAKRVSVVDEKNQLYDRDGVLAKSGCALRVRTTSDGKHILTYKGPKLKGKIKRRQEIESIIESKPCGQILNSLGFRPTIQYSKHRETYQKGKLYFMLDRIKGSRWYLEIEGATRDILKAENDLGLFVSDREDRTYIEILNAT